MIMNLYFEGVYKILISKMDNNIRTTHGGKIHLDSLFILYGHGNPPD